MESQNILHKAKDIAEHIIWLRNSVCLETTPMHAIKLPYICHGWMLGLHGQSLIDEPVEAWKYGPVIPSIYQTYRAFGGNPITTHAKEYLELSTVQSELIKQVAEGYQDYVGWQLSAITHKNGTPWHEVYQDGAGLFSIIPNEIIQKYYEGLSTKK